MKQSSLLLFISTIVLLFLACSSNELKKQNGIQLNPTNQSDKEIDPKEKLIAQFRTRPTDVLLTGHPEHRLVTIYKINYNRRTKHFYTGENRFHRTYSTIYYEDRYEERYNNFMPGIEVVYGYNMMNMSHYHFGTKEQRNLFEEPVLINNFYYPSYRVDSLDNQPLLRDYYMVSVYDEDTNQDSLINRKDLRRFYHFDLEGVTKTALVPTNYSVMSSEYDWENDFMFVFAKLDENENGKSEEEEPIHVFWLDLKVPKAAERLY